MQVGGILCPLIPRVKFVGQALVLQPNSASRMHINANDLHESGFVLSDSCRFNTQTAQQRNLNTVWYEFLLFVTIWDHYTICTRTKENDQTAFLHWTHNTHEYRGCIFYIPVMWCVACNDYNLQERWMFQVPISEMSWTLVPSWPSETYLCRLHPLASEKSGKACLHVRDFQ